MPVIAQVSDKCSPEDLVEMIGAFNPDNLPGRLAVVVRMGAAKLRAHLPALIQAVEAAGQVGAPPPPCAVLSLRPGLHARSAFRSCCGPGRHCLWLGVAITLREGRSSERRCTRRKTTFNLSRACDCERRS